MSGATPPAADAVTAPADEGEQGEPADRRSQDPLQAAVQSTGRLVWETLPSIVVVSVAWFVASLPVVTVGPATVGAYRAVLALRAGDGLDVAAIRRTVRRQFVHATLLGLFPVVVGLVAANYALAYLATGDLVAGALALGGLYFVPYATLVLVPTFVRLASGADVATALWDGYRFTARHVVGTIVLGTVTVALLALSSLLTVAVVLIFAGVACAFHVEFCTAIDDDFRRFIDQ